MRTDPSRRIHDRLLVVHCGDGDAPVPAAMVVRLTPTGPTRDEALAALAATGLSSADVRTRVLFSTSAAPEVSAVAWAAAVGFFGRLLDIVVGDRSIVFGPGPTPDAGQQSGQVLAVGQVARVMLAAAAADPERVADVCVQFGAPHDSVVEVDADPDGLDRVRSARRVRVALVTGDTFGTLGRVALAAAARHRDGLDRLPALVVGDEPFDPDAKSPGGVDLDAVRRAAHGVRKAARVDDRSAVVEPVPTTARQQRLVAAAAVDVEVVLAGLGADRTGVDRPGASSVWTCPVAVHGDGDDRATVQVVRGRAQCVRCGRDKHDALRLVMWARGCTADEAAADIETMTATTATR